ncbi:hypothetical protein [Aquirhabdus parva]|uniref:Uncharacterized protein n=1 Tax=Aquirhabdus parva TaxID=2283318 RepID=A0A345P990_9GAMM|nr:hypothetical protein [Aquirhabdus parva]AXI03849.1 hypothetical protein HYN46_13995 [Aquirhabdus parva]
MILVIKRVGEFPKSVSIEPWGTDIPLAEFYMLKLVLHGVTNESEVHIRPCDGDRLSIGIDGLYRADVFINGFDFSHKYEFK